MEYERHANRLVLGFLKNNCSSAYKAFLKHTFQNQGKHIHTRIAGQNLEDILRTYSRMSEIVQGRIEDTNYPVEYGSEKLTPIFLVDQLLYLLDCHSVKHFPRSRRTSTESSVTEFTESHAVDNEKYAAHISDVETTPENSLPGNVNYYSSKKTSNDRSTVSRRKPTRVEKVVDKETLSEVMSETLLQNTEFQQKLASTITTVLNSPDLNAKKYCDKATAELDTTIKNVLQKTEADPMFEEVLQEFLGAPLSNPQTKPAHDTLSTTSSDHHVMDRIAPSTYSSTHTDRGSESSDVNETYKETPVKKNSSVLNNVPELNFIQEQPQPLVQPQPFNTSNPSNTPSRSVPQQLVNSTTSNNPIYINPTTGGLFMVPQPYYVINQPISIPSSCQPILMQSVDQTTVTYDSGVSNTQTEANNIQEYLTMYDDAKPSPLVKQKGRGLKKVIYPKKRACLQPRPTVKVEILHVTEKRPTDSDSSNKTENRDMSGNKGDKNMPCVSLEQEQDNSANNAPKTIQNNPKNSENSNSESETKKKSVQKEILSGPKLITPSPSVTTVQKRTPRSGSHVRNLTFPSPTKESRMSRSSDAKLCLENNQNKLPAVSQPLCWDAGLRQFVDPVPEKKSPKKKTKTPRKASKATELNVTETQGKLLEEALKTPKDVKKVSKTKISKIKSEILKNDLENDKKILSPSKLNASKRNLLYETGVENENQPNCFEPEETPLKNFPITPGIRTNETPFTPMLQANLKEITGGDIFCIDTPNFPVTPGLPGLSFMGTSSTNYYIFQEDEKAFPQDVRKSDIKNFSIDKTVNNDQIEKKNESTAEIHEPPVNKKRKNSDDLLENQTKKSRLSPKKNNSTKTPKKTVNKPSPKKGKVMKKSPGVSKSPTKLVKKKPLENGVVKKRQTRSTVLSKLKNNKPSNSPRNDSDDQCNFFKASGTNLKKLKNNNLKKQENTSGSLKNNTEIDNSPTITQFSDEETELHFALLRAREEFTICHFNPDSHVYAQNETTTKTSLPYDASILNKKQKLTVFTAQDEELQIILSATKFNTLLDIEEVGDGDVSKEPKEPACGEPLGVKSTKRRSRSDSNSSHNSTSSKIKDPNLAFGASASDLLKQLNISSFINDIHGQEPSS